MKRGAACVLVVAALGGCSRSREKADPPTADAAPRPVPAPAYEPSASPRRLYLPDATAPLPSTALVVPPFAPPSIEQPRGTGRCPPEMVDIMHRFCIDRFEATLLDARTGNALSPYYHPAASCIRREYERWEALRADAPTPEGRALVVPPPPDWELAATRFELLALSRPDVVPNGYMSGDLAEAACRRAGKRLCSDAEWVTACRGERDRKFPYGDVYEEGRCNVYRPTHPARVLHGDASNGHHDPRLNQVSENGVPLLMNTGSLSTCKSEWGDDAVYDMVGNLDEWVDDPDGTFLGGFFSRSTKSGCDARVETHGYDYYDYSLGVRCCK